MRMGTVVSFALGGLLGCGGASPGRSGPGSAVNAFTGTLTITSALPAGTTTCAATHTVTFRAGGVDLHVVSAAGGECLSFTNADAAKDHQPASIGSPACPQLNAQAPLAPGQSFTTAPLGGPATCLWQDLLNPPGGAGY